MSKKYILDLDNNNDWIQVINKKYKNNTNYESDNDYNNLKKILCYNIITNKKCNYNNKCMYAHTLSEQNVEPKRKNAYDILLNNNNLSNINLKTNYTLYNSLLELTKSCDLCIIGKCTGGYNCKYGVCLKKLCICIKDLNFGNCNIKCDLIHLTKRGLVPFYKINEFNNNLFELIKTEEIAENKYLPDDISENLSFSDSEESIDEYDSSIFDKIN